MADREALVAREQVVEGLELEELILGERLEGEEVEGRGVTSLIEEGVEHLMGDERESLVRRRRGRTGMLKERLFPEAVGVVSTTLRPPRAAWKTRPWCE